MEVIAEQIAHIETVANGWCDFAIVCGCLGLALSIVAAIMYFKMIKEENNGQNIS